MDEKLYVIFLYLVLLSEIVLSIPLFVDSLLGTKGLDIIFVLLFVHLGMFLYGTIMRLHTYDGKIHVYGVTAFVINFIPVISFIFHLVVVISIIKQLRKVHKEKMF